MCYDFSMRGNFGLFVSSADCARLAAIVADRNSRQKHAQRAHVVLLTGERFGTAEIMRRTGLSKPSVWRWQERYVEAGVDGLLRDKTRPSRIPRLTDEKVALVVRLTMEEPPPADATHWTVRAMAAKSGVSTAMVHRIWQENGLAPHRFRQFKLSNDPAFASKIEDVIGLYVDPPAHAVVLSIDEKSQIQALDRTQPGLPMKRGRLATMTHDYKRHGTTTLFAALNVLDGTVIGQNRQRRRHQEFIQFLNAVERQVPADKSISMSCWTTMPPTSTPRSAAGSPGTRAGPSTSRPRRALGSTPSKASSPSSRVGGSNTACYIRSSTCSRRSTPSSRRTTQSPSHSSGRPIRRRSSLPPGAGTKC